MEPTTAMVIFGVTGDLARRKLVPALYELTLLNRLPDNFFIVGFARRDWTDAEMHEEMETAVNQYARTQPVDPDVFKRLCDKMRYIQSTFEDPDGYRRLGAALMDLEAVNYIYYLATPPESYETIIQQLTAVELNCSAPGWTRLVVEKPYGHDLKSAIGLDAVVLRSFSEDQVYRMDHYLGKDTVQNILVFRFANGIFEPLWNNRYISHVQIIVAETVGIEGRANYYEKAGVIRDIFQNHMLQLLALTAMESPVQFKAEAVRNEKVKVLQALRPLRGEAVFNNTVCGQYGPGVVNGKAVKGYREEPGVDPNSTTETYLAARLFIDDWRWSGVPFYVRSGKAMAKRLTEIVIQFRQVPLSLFTYRNLAGDAPNMLGLCIQPCEEINLSFGAKAPGPMDAIKSVKMNFNYQTAFGSEQPEAYERLLLDVFHGDPTLFTRSDEVLAAWSFTMGIIDAWKSRPVQQLPNYPAGTWGPPEADDFIRRDGYRWRAMAVSE